MKNSLISVFAGRINSFLLLLVFMGLNSCEKEDLSPNACQDGSKIRQVKSDKRVLEEMTYTGECLLFEHIREFSYKKYSYNEQGRLFKTEQAFNLDPTSCFMPVGSTGEIYADSREAPITQYNSFEYDKEGTLIKKLDYFLNGDRFQLVSYATYDYADGYVKQLNLHNPQGELSQKHIYTNDGNGNIMRDEYYFREAENIFVLIQTLEYEFDDKINPYRVFEKDGIPGMFTNQNNIVKITVTDYYSTQDNRNTTAYSYDYDASGLPVKRDDLTFIYGE